MKKKLLSVMLAVTLSVSCMTPLIALAEEDVVTNDGAGDIVRAGSCGENATYTLDTDGVLTISGNGEIDDTFMSWNDVNSVNILPEITRIGAGAFDGCSNLSNISIPEGVTAIGNDAFRDCSSLSSISIPASVTNIGDCAFSRCSSLSSINIPENVTSIGWAAFYECSSLSNIVIPESVTNIDMNTFYGCSSLSSMVIPKGVISIRFGAFYGCSSLKSITISESVTNIGDCAFYGCDNLESIIIARDNTVYDSRDNCNAIIDTNANRLIVGCKNTVIPTSVTIVGTGAFSECNSLKNIRIPEGIIQIDDAAFYYCSSLSNIIIPTNVTCIGDNAFEGCDNLTISCYKDSAAHKYAVENKINYKLLDAKPSQTKTNIKSATIVVNDLTYNKKAQTVSPKVSISGKTLTQGKDYTISGNTTVTDIGTYKITITGIGEYTGSVNVTYRLSCKHNYDEKWTVDKKANMKNAGKKSRHCTICNAKADETVIQAIKTVSLSKTSFTYNGKNRKPSVTVRDTKGNTLRKGTDYTVSYPKNCKKVGQYTVTIKFKGNYTGSTKKTYCINPKGTSLSEVKAKSKSFMAKWKKQTTQTRGYQLQYATDKKFKKNVKNVTIKKNKTTSQTVRKLKAKKKYYVRIRTYQTIKVNGKEKKLYSDWSKAKNVTVKK